LLAATIAPYTGWISKNRKKRKSATK